MQNRYASGLSRRVTMGTEGVRFELTRPFGLPVFKTGAINRSATPPDQARIRDRKLITPLLRYSKGNHAAFH